MAEPERSVIDAERLRRLRSLPSVQELASGLSDRPHRAAVGAARKVIGELRERILAGEGEEAEAEAQQLRELAAARVKALARASLRPVVNATGVIIHTNLGRAPLAQEASEAAAVAGAGYSNLEYDLTGGDRGSRQAHIEPLLCELTGAERAIAVNNNAAAVLLALAAIASGKEAVVSRGELVEIGGSFRVPEVLEQSGARLVEVGTTNRTRLSDYEAAIGEGCGCVLRVHQSNFRILGFTEAVALESLCELAHERGVPVIDDLGSGSVEGVGDERAIADSLRAGADLVCCSADKLLGGPQAGLLMGSAEAVERCRAHPLARAVRIDKLQLAALEATLRLHRDEGPPAIPVLAMLTATEGELRTRADLIAEHVGAGAEVVRSTGRAGGGTLPETELEGHVCAVDPGPRGAEALASELRASEPPVIARIASGKLLLDPRTMSDEEARLAAEVVCRALDR